MIAKEFPDNVATMFAILETFFGIGMILGKLTNSHQEYFKNTSVF